MADKDVLGKADALLRRHVLPLPGAASDLTDVPVLTEVFDAPGAPAPEPDPDLVRAVTEAVTREVEARLAGAIGSLREELANTIREAVRQELERRHVK